MWPSVQIKDKTLTVPIIQGGMGVGISLGNLAGHVAACGGMGVLSSAHAGYRADDFWSDPQTADVRELTREVEKAKAIAGGQGMVGVNVMVAVKDYAEHIQAAIAGGADAIISGAGLPLNLPELVKGSDVAIAPIVSSGKAASLICRTWDKKHQRTPDFIVIEGSQAGGHLGFKKEELLAGTTAPLLDILADVLAVLPEFAEKYGHAIPVFVAGGIYDGADIAEAIAHGASGVQMATRFIVTKECDASPAYKEAYIKAKASDIQIVSSPVGMPGRALRSPLIERLERETRIPVERCIACLRPCKPAETPYCITKALIEAAKGNWEEGLFFCGAHADRLDRIMTVDELMQELTQGYEQACQSE